MEFKELTPQEYLDMFPKIKLSELAKQEFLKTTKLTRVVKLKGARKFRPIFMNSNGAYYLVGNKEVYLPY